MWLSDPSQSGDVHITEFKQRHDTKETSYPLTLSKSCKKAISKIKSINHVGSEQKQKTCFKDIESNTASKSSVLICNENMHMLESESPHKTSLRKSCKENLWSKHNSAQKIYNTPASA